VVLLAHVKVLLRLGLLRGTVVDAPVDPEESVVERDAEEELVGHVWPDITSVPL